MERIEHMAELSIRRGLGFAGLAIVTMLVGFIYDPALALKVTANSLAIVAAILLLKGMRAPARNYRRTEVWLLLDRRHGLPEERAQGVIGGVLQRLYWRYARLVGALTGGTWVLSFLA